MSTWDFLPSIVRPYFVRRIAILGAESTGKTHLAAHLAQRFQTTWAREYGREYCATRDPLRLTPEDFDAIGRGQVLTEDAAAVESNRGLMCDTDLLTTCTWSDMITGKRSEWLADAARKQQYALTLLLGDDASWVDDGTRVLERRRVEHTERLQRELADAGRTYTTLRGPFQDRLRVAVQLVERVLAPLAAPEHLAPAS